VYYETEYLIGRQPLIPSSDFAYWEKAARSEINKKNLALDDPPDNLKQCVCEIAEVLYTQAQASSLDRVKSFNNDGYSVTYSADSKTQNELAKTICGIVFKHLAGTNLHNLFVFAGVS